MIDKVIESAQYYKQEAARTLSIKQRFPFALPSDRNETAAMLLGTYSALVESRGGTFILDDNLKGKIDKIVKWLYDSKK